MKCILVCIVINGLLFYKEESKEDDSKDLEKLQKQIDDIDLKIKEYTSMKKDYEKLEKKYNDITQSTPKEENKNE